MQYFASSNDWTDCAMLLGLYERELIPIIEEVAKGKWSRFIEIGCAQGYYAIGIALTAPVGLAIIAFDGNPEAIGEAKRKAAVNKVEQRIEWRGMANLGELQALELNGNDFLLVDIDGGERELLDPERIPALCACDILIETHDFIDPGVSELLKTRFESTHSCLEFTWKPVEKEEIPFPEATALHAQCVNGRPEQKWLWLQPRVRSLGGQCSND